jgi:hypothetical protein
MRTALICIAVLAFHFEAVAAQVAVLLTNRGDYEAGYKKGVAAADRELKAGKATLFIYGLLEDLELLDRETGLPLKPIAGCGANNEIVGRAAGHNKRIREYIAKEGLPSGSFKRWENGLFNLKEYYAWRTKTEKPIRLTPGGPAVKFSDGMYSIRLGKRQVKGKGGTLNDELFIVIRVAEVDHQASVWLEGNVDFFWGPKKSGFALIQCEDDRGSSFTALDLKMRRTLRREYKSRAEGPRAPAVTTR